MFRLRNEGTGNGAGPYSGEWGYTWTLRPFALAKSILFLGGRVYTDPRQNTPLVRGPMLVSEYPIFRVIEGLFAPSYDDVGLVLEAFSGNRAFACKQREVALPPFSNPSPDIYDRPNDGAPTIAARIVPHSIQYKFPHERFSH